MKIIQSLDYGIRHGTDENHIEQTTGGQRPVSLLEDGLKLSHRCQNPTRSYTQFSGFLKGGMGRNASRNVPGVAYFKDPLNSSCDK